MSIPLTTEQIPEDLDVPNDDLTQLELQIARRADELIRVRGCDGTLHPWIQAEREIISQSLEQLLAS